MLLSNGQTSIIFMENVVTQHKNSFYNYIYNQIIIVKNYLISKRKSSMIKALLHFIDKDKKWSLKVLDSFKMIEQKFKTCEGKILRLEQIEQFCISKNMALILYVLRIRPCFWKNKILHLEKVLEFSLRQVT